MRKRSHNSTRNIFRIKKEVSFEFQEISSDDEEDNNNYNEKENENYNEDDNEKGKEKYNEKENEKYNEKYNEEKKKDRGELFRAELNIHGGSRNLLMSHRG